MGLAESVSLERVVVDRVKEFDFVLWERGIERVYVLDGQVEARHSSWARRRDRDAVTL